MLGDDNEDELNAQLAIQRSIVAVLTLAPWGQFPRTLQIYTPYPLIDEGEMLVVLSYNRWTKSEYADLAKAGVDSILIPQTRPYDKAAQED